MNDALMITCYTLMAYGMSLMFVFGTGPFKIFERIRVHSYAISKDGLGKLFTCMMCFPGMFGLIMSIVSIFSPIHFTPFTILFNGSIGLCVLGAFFDSAYTSGMVWAIHHIVELFEKKAEESGIIYEDEGDDDNGNVIDV